MYMPVIFNNEQSTLLGFVSIGPNNQPHAIISIKGGDIKAVPISEIKLDDAGNKEVKKKK